MTCKILHGLCPKIFAKNSLKARNCMDLQSPKVTLEYAKQGFYISGVKTGTKFLAKFAKKNPYFTLAQWHNAV